MTPPRWLLIDGTAHYYRRWTEDGSATTWCKLLVRPQMSDFIKEPKPPQRECRRCTDHRGIA
jgi:hypothetical protein